MSAVTSIGADTLEQAADCIALLQQAERAYTVEDVPGLYLLFNSLDPAQLAELERTLRERALRAIDMSPVFGAGPKAAPSPSPEKSTVSPRAPLYAVPAPEGHSVAWWLVSPENSAC